MFFFFTATLFFFLRLILHSQSLDFKIDATAQLLLQAPTACRIAACELAGEKQPGSIGGTGAANAERADAWPGYYCAGDAGLVASMPTLEQRLANAF